jgi:isopenicillin N synthase-like dioxygenase
MFVSSLIHYPAVTVQSLPSETIRFPAHSDMSTLTLLFQRNVGGLQVADMNSMDKTSSAAVNESAIFWDIEPNPELILINAGYLLMRWTNGRWKNAVHRVLMNGVEAGDTAPERQSVAFFSFPDSETSVEALSTCCSEDSPRIWKPLNAGEYLRRKRGALYS